MNPLICWSFDPDIPLVSCLHFILYNSSTYSSRMLEKDGTNARVALRYLHWIWYQRAMEAVWGRDGFLSLSHLHPVIVHEPGLPECCLYLPLLTDVCCQSVWDGPQYPSPSRWLDLIWVVKKLMAGKRLISFLSLLHRCASAICWTHKMKAKKKTLYALSRVLCIRKK